MICCSKQVLRLSVGKQNISLHFYIVCCCPVRGRQGSLSFAEGLLFLCNLLLFFMKVSVRLKPTLEQSFVIRLQ